MRAPPVVSGDKLSTSHGQKGVAVVVDDMSRGLTKEWGEIEFDVCMSCISVISAREQISFFSFRASQMSCLLRRQRMPTAAAHATTL